jgi:Fic-DOC domain mobile mystery protein B
MGENDTRNATGDDDDNAGLIQTRLKTKAARNVAELEAIDEAYDKYVFRPKRGILQGEWLSDSFIRQVHRDMFGTIWDWAGIYRQKDLNLGMDWHQIPQQIGQICGDFNYWNSPDCEMSVIEIAARLQNRLTRIHPFRNGNGRHARLLTDIFLQSCEHDLPKWPQIHLLTHGHAIRERYMRAMRAADKEDYSALMALIKEWISSGP